MIAILTLFSPAYDIPRENADYSMIVWYDRYYKRKFCVGFVVVVGGTCVYRGSLVNKHVPT